LFENLIPAFFKCEFQIVFRRLANHRRASTTLHASNKQTKKVKPSETTMTRMKTVSFSTSFSDHAKNSTTAEKFMAITPTTRARAQRLFPFAVILFFVSILTISSLSISFFMHINTAGLAGGDSHHYDYVNELLKTTMPISSTEGMQHDHDETENSKRTSLYTTRSLYMHDHNSNMLDGLPDWLVEYLTWHDAMRRQFPDTQLLTHVTAPKILIRLCQFNCGGTNDRMTNMLDFLYIASQTKRVLLYQWFHPAPLEKFLVPAHVINWTMPLINNMTTTPEHYKELFKIYNHESALMVGLERYEEKSKILYLPQRQGTVSHDGMIPSTMTETELFSRVWNLMFRPSTPVQEKIDQTMASLELIPRQYIAAHCRVKHPARKPLVPAADGAAGGGALIQPQNWEEADRKGLVFEGRNREMALQSATRALQCAKQQQLQEQEPVYLLSDSEDLIRFMVENTTTTANTTHTNSILSDIERAAREAKASTRVVARNTTNWPSAHLDRPGSSIDDYYPIEDYYATFVDIYIAAAARCILLGMGNFMSIAARIGGVQDCLISFETFPQAKIWGRSSTMGAAKTCKL
jgi:ribonuclease HI